MTLALLTIGIAFGLFVFGEGMDLTQSQPCVCFSSKKCPKIQVINQLKTKKKGLKGGKEIPFQLMLSISCLNIVANILSLLGVFTIKPEDLQFSWAASKIEQTSQNSDYADEDLLSQSNKSLSLEELVLEGSTI